MTLFPLDFVNSFTRDRLSELQRTADRSDLKLKLINPRKSRF